MAVNTISVNLYFLTKVERAVMKDLNKTNLEHD